ncbi:MAG: YtxH domain-containing protein [Bacilli bacterium]|nr:YtxH domain-containing protein [Bacilli bacterium]
MNDFSRKKKKTKNKRKEEDNMSKTGIGEFILGVGIGVGIGLLVSPNTGEENRKIVKEKASQAIDKIKNIDLDKVKEDLSNKYEKLKEELKDMDAEKAKKIVKDKVEELSIKTNELIAAAREKADPVIEAEGKKLKKNLSALLNKWADKLED